MFTVWIWSLSKNFNTSNVSVEFFSIFLLLKTPTFQYFKCVGWIFRNIYNYVKGGKVSILQMCRLNVSALFEGRPFIMVSILQMCRLNELFLKRRTLHKKVSILQMCRLNIEANKWARDRSAFQYFKCVGWILYPLNSLIHSI